MFENIYFSSTFFLDLYKEFQIQIKSSSEFFKFQNKFRYSGSIGNP